MAFKERCQLLLANCIRSPCVRFMAYFCGLLFALFVIGTVSFSGVWIVVILGRCQKTPMLALEDVSIQSMTVYANITEDQWQVKSEFNVSLFTRNNNSVVGCFSTFRRMVVKVRYHDQLILQQEVPLGFGLKPKENRSVVVQVEGDHFPVDSELGQLLDADLQTESHVKLQMNFNARVMRHDRKAKWVRLGCQVVAQTPLNSSQMSGNLLFKSCGPS